MEYAVLRSATLPDLPAIAAIYAWHVLHGTGTFETEPPSEGEMGRRLEAVLASGLPWLVAEQGGQVVGFAYAQVFRPRPAYRFTAEDSIYVAPSAVGQGIGRLLLAELLDLCAAAGVRQVLAVIGDADNAPSLGLHRALGFDEVGRMHAVGWKHGRWLDVVIMQVGLGGDGPPG